MNAVHNVSVFLISLAFSTYVAAVILRFLLASVRANFYNPISQFLVKITNPLLVPMRRFIPPMGKVDTAAIVLALGLTFVEMILLSGITGTKANIITLLFAAVIELLETIVQIYIVALLARMILSWFGGNHNHPIEALASSLTEPLVEPARRYIPSMGGFDFAPTVVLLGLYIVLIILRS